MSKAVITPGQSFFTFGVETRSITALKDSTRDISSTSDNLLAGGPVALLNGSAAAAVRGKLTNVTMTNVVTYGISETNANTFDGKTTLGEFRVTKADVGLSGIYTVRKSTFLDNTGTEVAISPFSVASFASGLPTTAEIGTILTVGLVDNSDGLGSIIRWNTGGTATTLWSATILDVRDAAEVDLLIQ